MLVFELPLQICFLIPMPSENVSERIARLLDAALQRTESFWKEMSWRYPFRPYTFDQPYPLEAEHIYCVGKIYTVRIRTISQELAEFFSSVLPFCGSDCLQILGGELRLIPRCFLERVHTLTPVVVKTRHGY